MKRVLVLSITLLLSACESAPTLQSSFNGMHYTSAPTSIHDPRLGQPAFYRDDDDGGWWTHASNPRAN